MLKQGFEGVDYLNSDGIILPDEFTIPEENIPPPHNQGSTQMCSSFVLAAIMGVYAKRYYGEDLEFSPSYIDGAYRADENRNSTGAFERRALEGVTTAGACLLEDFPEMIEGAKSYDYVRARPELIKKAKKYAEMFAGFIELKGQSDEAVFEKIKIALYKYSLPLYGTLPGHAVAFCGWKNNCIKYRDSNGTETLWPVMYNKIKGAFFLPMAERNNTMKTSKTGISLIKSFEGLSLKACKAIPSEQYYTIGYGHYGPDVSKDMVITKEYAEELLKADLVRFENAVGTYVPFELNQNQFDALVSFTYNCGIGSLQILVKNRTPEMVADKLLLYDKAGGKTLLGLTRRRKAERELFLKEWEGLTVTQYEELKKMIEELQPIYYDWTEACPEWSRPYVHKALELGIIKGDDQGRLRLTDDKIWCLVVQLRANGIME